MYHAYTHISRRDTKEIKGLAHAPTMTSAEMVVQLLSELSVTY